jgi:hypothetical protein
MPATSIRIYLPLCLLSGLVCLLSDLRVYAQEAKSGEAGYYISLNHDSVPAKIKIYKWVYGLNVEKYFGQVETEAADSGGRSGGGGAKTFHPGEILGFGFNYKSESYRFMTGPTRKYNMFWKPGTDSGLNFLIPLATGARTSVYYYYILTGGLLKNVDSFTRILYTFERPDGRHLWMTSYAKRSVFQEALSDFYGDYPGMRDFIASLFGMNTKKFSTRGEIEKDIVAVVARVNAGP